MSEKHYRSIVKAISWRATGTLDTIVVAFIICGRLRVALSIGLVEVFTKITLYYLHERIWNKIPLGKLASKNPEYYI
jgi:uncharacterized membrane protein